MNNRGLLCLASGIGNALADSIGKPHMPRQWILDCNPSMPGLGFAHLVERSLKVREIIPCQTCNRDIEDLGTGLVVWCTTKDKPGAPSIKVVHRKPCDPWKGNAPHSLPLEQFRDQPQEMRRLWASMVKDGGIAAVMAWEVLGRIYEGITDKEFFRAEEAPAP